MRISSWLWFSSGQPTAAILRDDSDLVENLLFWVACKDTAEANYLLAIINSQALYDAVSGMMPKGQFGARHLHKHLWKLPIPGYDPEQELHVAIAEAGVAAAAGAAGGVARGAGGQADHHHRPSRATEAAPHLNRGEDGQNRRCQVADGRVKMPSRPGPPYEWDEDKSAENLRLRGFSFDLVERFNWTRALTRRDLRIENEERWVSLGLVDERMHVMVWTPRGPYTRIISIRKANDREAARYAQAKS